MGALPDQVPAEADSVWACAGDPEMTGSDELTGVAAPTTADAADAAEALPTEFVAVTNARNVDPTSPVAAVYDAAVAPEIALQEPPPVSQRCHWYAYVC